jgi:hypothetical protein
MSRSLIRFAVALAPPLLAILIAAALVSGAELQHIFLGPGTTGHYCYAWDIANNTGQDAGGLRIRLKGVQSISEVYTGTANPFGAPHPTSGYDGAADMYTLVFSDGVAFDSDVVHIGVCAGQPILQLADPPATWTANDQALQPVPLFAGLSAGWQGSAHLQLHLFNSQATTVTVMELYVLDAAPSLALDDLDADTAGTMATAAIPVTEPQTLPPGADSFFDVIFDPPAFQHTYLVQVMLAAEDDPGHTFQLFSPVTSPPATVFLPIAIR